MNKYRNVPTGGYRSKAEADHALWLEAERRSGRIKSYEYEKCYELLCDKKLICKHYPDFSVVLKSGLQEIHEVKGGQITQTPVWRLKRKLFEANYPWIRYRVFEFGGERRKRVIQLEDE